MPKNVILAALLPATPDKLFDMYLDAESHAAITGASVIIEPRAGALVHAFNGVLSDSILHVEPKRLIVHEPAAPRPAPAGLEGELLVLRP